MEPLVRMLILLTLLMVASISLHVHFASATIGVNYGLQGDNLPPPSEVINLCTTHNITLLKLAEPPTLGLLGALKSSTIKIAVGVKDSNVPDIAASTATAIEWLQTYIVPYAKDVNFEYITVGNELIPGPHAEEVSLAINNLLSALNVTGLTNIKVTTIIGPKALGTSYPPSAGEFLEEIKMLMQQISIGLKINSTPLFINVYPYLSYVSDPKNFSLAFALGNSDKPGIIDGSIKYYSLLNAMVDTFYSALYKVKGEFVKLAISETGWPNAGNGEVTSKENAETYNQKVIDTVKKQGNDSMDVFIFSLFNENKKAVGVDQNWGIFYPNKDPVYPLTF